MGTNQFSKHGMVNVVAAIIQKGGLFLIAKRKKGKHLENKWEFPGGKMEPGEIPEKCLERELKEELGICIKTGDFLTESICDYGDRKIRLLGYRAQYVSGDFTLNDHEEINWVSRDELGRFDFAEADLPLIAALINEV